MTREEHIRGIADQLAEQILRNNADAPIALLDRKDHVKVFVNGWIDLEKLAEWVYVRVG